MSSEQESDVPKNPGPEVGPEITDNISKTTPDATNQTRVQDPKLSSQSSQILSSISDGKPTLPFNTSPNLVLSNIFGFIENLAAQTDKVSATSKMHSAPPEVRRTSDLLDTLQKALMKPPPSSRSTDGGTIPVAHSGDTATKPCGDNSHFPVGVRIENAVNVTKMCVRINKKSSKPHRSKTDHFHSVQEQDASTYVTFEAQGTSAAMVNSPDGMVHTTQVVERTSNPTWNKHFDVMLPVELLTNIHKRFILKVWRKSGTDSPQTKLTPTPFQDSIVGFVTINISLLLNGADSISDWFNVTDLYGRCNGRIKITVTPKESVERYRHSTDAKQITPSTGDQDDSDAAAVDLEHNALLNQTLKRKFTELEDITKRLKARLVDVTDDADFGDLEDEFETDLNTLPDEEEEDEHFDWVEAVQDTSLAVDSKKESEQKAVESDETVTSVTDKSKDHEASTQASDPSDAIISKAMQQTLIKEPNKIDYINY